MRAGAQDLGTIFMYFDEIMYYFAISLLSKFYYIGALR